MALDEPALQSARPLDSPAKLKDIDTTAANAGVASEDEGNAPISPAHRKLLVSAAERFTLGMRKKPVSSTVADSFTPPQSLSSLSPTQPSPSGHQPLSIQPQKQPQPQPQPQPMSLEHAQDPSSSTTTEQHADVPVDQAASDNPFDFEFRNPFSKRFHLGSHRKSVDNRRTSVVVPGISHAGGSSTSAAVGASSGSEPISAEDDPARMMQLRQVFNKFFKRKKDKKGKNADQVFEMEDYQLWNNLSPLVFQPSAVFMGLSFMIEDKGSALTDKNTVDWNMNIILALVKV